MKVDTDFVMSINGESVTTEHTLPVYNPATRSVFAKVPDASKAQLDTTVIAAREAFALWSNTPVDERQAALEHFADLLEERGWVGGEQTAAAFYTICVLKAVSVVSEYVVVELEGAFHSLGREDVGVVFQAKDEAGSVEVRDFRAVDCLPVIRTFCPNQRPGSQLIRPLISRRPAHNPRRK